MRGVEWRRSATWSRCKAALASASCWRKIVTKPCCRRWPVGGRIFGSGIMSPQQTDQNFLVVILFLLLPIAVVTPQRFIEELQTCLLLGYQVAAALAIGLHQPGGRQGRTGRGAFVPGPGRGTPAAAGYRVADPRGGRWPWRNIPDWLAGPWTPFGLQQEATPCLSLVKRVEQGAGPAGPPVRPPPSRRSRATDRPLAHPDCHSGPAQPASDRYHLTPRRCLVARAPHPWATADHHHHSHKARSHNRCGSHWASAPPRRPGPEYRPVSPGGCPAWDRPTTAAAAHPSGGTGAA